MWYNIYKEYHTEVACMKYVSVARIAKKWGYPKERYAITAPRARFPKRS